MLGIVLAFGLFLTVQGAPPKHENDSISVESQISSIMSNISHISHNASYAELENEEKLIRNSFLNDTNMETIDILNKNTSVIKPKYEYNSTNIASEMSSLMRKISYIITRASSIVVENEEKFIIKSHLNDTKKEAHDILNQNPSVIILKKEFEAAVANGENVGECQELFEELLSDLTDSFEQIVISDFKWGGKVIDLGTELIKIEFQALNGDLLAEVIQEMEICQFDTLNCRIPKEGVDEINMLEHIIDDIIEGSGDRLAAEVYETLKLKASDEIIKKVLLPVKECVNN